MSEWPPDRPRWIRVTAGGRLPAQGWKLHVSADVSSADDVLARSLHVLLGERATFKVAADARCLGALNAGRSGASQIGKFLTVYPRDDTQAVLLADRLHRATLGLDGPDVPSDLPAAPRPTLVHRRYGAFGAARAVQNRLGEVTSGLVAPDGAVVPDVRGVGLEPPAWAPDPFPAAMAPRDGAVPLIAGRYLMVGRVHLSARGAVLLGVDLENPSTCILKQAPLRLGPAGGAPAVRLRREAAVLRTIGPDPQLPGVRDVVEADGDLYLVMDDLGAPSLSEHLAALPPAAHPVPVRTALAMARSLAALLERVHRRGVVHRDVTSTNVLVSASGEVLLTDLELAAGVGRGGGLIGPGTRGYASPEQLAGEAAAVTDDVHALGAVLYLLLTGAEPALAPDRGRLLTRPVELLRPGTPAAAAEIVRRCTAPRAADRYPDMAAVCAALASAGAPPAPCAGGGLTASHAGGLGRHDWAAMARSLGDALCGAARTDADGTRYWLGGSAPAGGHRCRDLHVGDAGVLLALADLVDLFGAPAHRAVLRAGAAGLLRAPAPAGERLPGLYVGDAGVAVALARAGRVLGDEALVEAAAERGHRVAHLPHTSPDLFHGTAGRLRAHALLWRLTGDDDHLRDARSAGDALLESRWAPSPGEACWTIPPGFEGLSGRSYLGYAHGVAGIADALLDVAVPTGDERYLDAVDGACRLLARTAEDVGPRGTWRDWPQDLAGGVTRPFWCHGAAGVARFLLRAAAAGLGTTELLARAAVAQAGAAARWAGPSQCHGLAGNVEVLLDAYRATGEDSFLATAGELAELLAAHLVRPDSDEDPGPEPRGHGYLTGDAGVLAALLRLTDPRRAHGLAVEAYETTDLPPGQTRTTREGGCRPTLTARSR